MTSVLCLRLSDDDCQVGLLVAAHSAHTARLNLQGISDVMGRARQLVRRLLVREDFRLMVRSGGDQNAVVGTVVGVEGCSGLVWDISSGVSLSEHLGPIGGFASLAKTATSFRLMLVVMVGMCGLVICDLFHKAFYIKFVVCSL